MDVLNNDEEEVKVNNRSSVSTITQQVSVKPATFGGIYSKRESQHDYMKDNLQTIQRNNKSQTLQNEQNKTQFNQLALQRFPQSTFSTAPNNNVGESPRNIPSYLSMGRGKSEMKEPVRREQRDSDYLQIRVKSAIEKSLLAIQKFKSIRSNPIFWYNNVTLYGFGIILMANRNRLRALLSQAKLLFSLRVELVIRFWGIICLILGLFLKQFLGRLLYVVPNVIIFFQQPK